jgi:phosphatidylinositol glycan class V
MLSVLIVSGLDLLRSSEMRAYGCAWGRSVDERLLGSLIKSAAIGQVLLALLAVTSYHVQIITRISSGYPLWYWWLASVLSGRKTSVGKAVLMFMVMYASIQAALFASFLPPA